MKKHMAQNKNSLNWLSWKIDSKNNWEKRDISVDYIVLKGFWFSNNKFLRSIMIILIDLLIFQPNCRTKVLYKNRNVIIIYNWITIIYYYNILVIWMTRLGSFLKLSANFGIKIFKPRRLVSRNARTCKPTGISTNSSHFRLVRWSVKIQHVVALISSHWIWFWNEGNKLYKFIFWVSQWD